MKPESEPELFPEDPSDQLGADPVELATLRQSVGELRNIVHYVIGLAILLALAVNVFMYYQSQVLRAQERALQRSVEELGAIVSQYESNSVPWFERFAMDLHRLATRDQEIARLVAKYQLPQPTNAPSPLPPPVSR
jgi:hypothetical protein